MKEKKCFKIVCVFAIFLKWFLTHRERTKYTSDRIDATKTTKGTRKTLFMRCRCGADWANEHTAHHTNGNWVSVMQQRAGRADEKGNASTQKFPSPLTVTKTHEWKRYFSLKTQSKRTMEDTRDCVFRTLLRFLLFIFVNWPGTCTFAPLISYFTFLRRESHTNRW